jgi:hypothetical protein
VLRKPRKVETSLLVRTTGTHDRLWVAAHIDAEDLSRASHCPAHGAQTCFRPEACLIARAEPDTLASVEARGSRLDRAGVVVSLEAVRRCGFGEEFVGEQSLEPALVFLGSPVSFSD